MKAIDQALDELQTIALMRSLSPREQTAIAHLIAANCAISDAKANAKPANARAQWQANSEQRAQIIMLLGCLDERELTDIKNAILEMVATDNNQKVAA